MHAVYQITQYCRTSSQSNIAVEFTPHYSPSSPTTPLGCFIALSIPTTMYIVSYFELVLHDNGVFVSSRRRHACVRAHGCEEHVSLMMILHDSVHFMATVDSYVAAGQTHTSPS
ncbi:hypothetical protein H310_01424 [Aphanomyces invadans]|uniref:Uncharacterized protein n=1 Tax=Aphanomyces invadans TaxID=157072 RepID=A0A024USR6_9STRA|nr:hypothetical protein H310_01424 [Aphanomyces invadans]ETW08942.1 hypothetical protein H310_01424 [Aphanomyces invadans]|eukprot:XP_008862747.1 hypothetical protein H310_01424 [Aphanomyces invadans]